MDIHDVRRARLRLLATQYNSQAELAHAADLDTGLMSRLIGAAPSKAIGNRLARRIEATLNLQHGWLDNLDLTTRALSDKFLTLPTAQQTLIGKLLDHPIDDEAAAALTTLIKHL